MAQEVFMWVAAWAVFVLAQSMFINGIKIAATGETEIKPNGKEWNSPMILYPLAKYIDQSHLQKVYYCGTEFRKLVKMLQDKFRSILPEWERLESEDGTFFFSSEQAVDIMKGVGDKLKVQDIETEIDGRSVRFYKEYRVYKYSKYIRMPTFGCIRCMSSFWSIFTYWLPMLLVFGYHDWMWLVWVANVPTVTFVNTYLAQRYT